MTYLAPAVSRERTHNVTIEHDSIVAVYARRISAEAAILALARSGFDMKNLSIVGRDQTTEEVVVGFLNPGDRMDVWARTGAFWGTLTETLTGAALLLIPEYGTLFAAGPIVGRVIRALEAKAVNGGLGALAAGLYSVGIPKNSIGSFEKQLKNGRFVVIAHGSRSEVESSRTILVETELHQGQAHACCK